MRGKKGPIWPTSLPVSDVKNRTAERRKRRFLKDGKEGGRGYMTLPFFRIEGVARRHRVFKKTGFWDKFLGKCEEGWKVLKVA
ncbi:MAG: hypothetical protein IIY80_04280 [Aeriscardovia sp.]|nr:hypothetical protein [Aeriscardovia sp.]